MWNNFKITIFFIRLQLKQKSNLKTISSSSEKLSGNKVIANIIKKDKKVLPFEEKVIKMRIKTEATN